MPRPCAPAVPGRPVEWRLVEDGPLSGRENMARDEALLEAQKDPAARPVLRLFRWDRPTVSYGRLQDPARAMAAAQRGGAADLVRRPTGGGLVRHDADVSLSLAWRRDLPDLPGCLKDVYRETHETLRAALAALGKETTLYAPPAGRAPGSGVCFDEPAEHDLMLDGRKVAGGALRVTSWGRLYQGNVLTRETGLAPDAVAGALARAFAERFFRREAL